MSVKEPLIPPLDPGALTSSTKRGRRSCCRLCIWILVALAVLGFIAVLGMIGVGLYSIALQTSNPHAELWKDVHSNTSRRKVVRPLVDDKQKFDIAVSVWVKATELEEYTLRLAESESSTPNATTDRSFEEIIWGLGWRVPFERPLFSDIVFRGLTIKDQHVYREVKFRLPTATFLRYDLDVKDLRGSVVLIPSSPSPLDHLELYASYMRQETSPTRSWPFPLGTANTTEHKTLKDKAIESFGFSIPLVEFHSSPKRCPGPDLAESTSSAAPISEPEYAGNGNDETSPYTPLAGGHKSHPYVVTRSQIRIVDETRMFDRKAYDQAHMQLRNVNEPCAEMFDEMFDYQKPPNLNCERSYSRNGHFETRLQLENEGTGHVSELVYPPYIDYLKYGSGPLDLVSVPVSRETCTIPANGTSPEVSFPKQDEEYMDVTWKISFSGRTPAKFQWANQLMDFVDTLPSRPVSEAERIKNHDSLALCNGIVGHKFENGIHPRRRLALGVLDFLFKIISIVLDSHYWYTRLSTVSISISGAAFSASGLILESFIEILVAIAPYVGEGLEPQSSRFLFMIPAVIMILLWHIPEYLVFKAILRVESDSETGFWRRARATHRERASERLDSKMGWKVRIGIFAVLLAYAYYFRDGIAIVPSSIVFDVEPSIRWIRALQKTLLMPLVLSGYIFQIVLNHRSRTFAGVHPIAAVLTMFGQFTQICFFIPALIGRVHTELAWTSHDMLYFAAFSAMAWQALTLPTIPQQSAGEDGDED